MRALLPYGAGPHLCPECDVLALLTREQKGAIHLDCPGCQRGTVFRDAEGGFGCTGCRQRFLVHQETRTTPLRWWEQPLSGWGLCAVVAAFGMLLLLLPSWSWVMLFFAKSSWDAGRKKT